MRIRLDKLFLSAGLALAVIATTIPAIAGVTTDTTTTKTATEGLTLSDETVDLSDSTDVAAFVKAVTGKEAAATEALSTKVTTVTKGTTVAASKVSGTAASVGDTLKNIMGTTLEKVASAIPDTYKVTVTTTYTYANYPYTLTNGANSDAAAQESAEAAAAALVEDTKVEADTPFDYGTYGITVTPNLNAEAKDTDATSGDPIFTANAVYNVSGTVVVEETYIVNSLPSGYTFDFVLGGTPAENKEYKVYRQGTDTTDVKEITDVTEVDNGQYFVASDLVSTYFVVAETISTAKTLVIPTVSNDTYDVYITQATAPSSDSAKTAITTAESDNGLTHVAYLDIDVLLNNNPVNKTDSAISFKIAPPTDVVSANEGKTITWYVVRNHTDDSNNVTTTVLDTTIDSDGYIVFSSDQFSDFALAYKVAADTTDTTEEATDSATDTTTDAATGTTTAGSSTTSTTTSTKTADNSMMPLFMTTLLLALCAGSLAIYKEKKTN